MGWRETCAVDERMRFVMAVEGQAEAFAAVCRRFGVSRKTGYKWLSRYREAGVEGLADHSRAPLHHPQAMSEEISEFCLAVRRVHPTWGPVKVRAWLERYEPATGWPAASAIGALFDREGLTVKRRVRRRCPPSSVPFGHCGAANDVWCMDFKGWFLTGDGTHCEPLTVSDAYSRYLLRCQVMPRTDTEHVWPVLEAAFREFGLPHRLRSDNGSPFASCGAGGLSKLAVKVIKAGVTPERIAPGKPQQNGRLERLHLTLLQDTAKPPARSLREQLERLRRFQHHAGRALRRLAAPLRRCPARARLRARAHGPAGTPQRRDPVAGKHHLRQRGADRRTDRLARNRGRRLDRVLWTNRTRHHRSPRRPSAQTQASGLWTCGQREDALPTRSTGPTTTAHLNKMGNVLPMSQVRTVTHVAGCSSCAHGRQA
jgi:putative transposase